MNISTAPPPGTRAHTPIERTWSVANSIPWLPPLVHKQLRSRVRRPIRAEIAALAHHSQEVSALQWTIHGYFAKKERRALSAVFYRLDLPIYRLEAGFIASSLGFAAITRSEVRVSLKSGPDRTDGPDLRQLLKSGPLVRTDNADLGVAMEAAREAAPCLVFYSHKKTYQIPQF